MNELLTVEEKDQIDDLIIETILPALEEDILGIGCDEKRFKAAVKHMSKELLRIKKTENDEE